MNIPGLMIARAEGARHRSRFCPSGCTHCRKNLVTRVDLTLFKVIVTGKSWKKQRIAADWLAEERFEKALDKKKGERRDAVARCA